MNKEIDTKFQDRLLTFLADFVLKRGWRLKLAKSQPIEQSLFIHSINELGVIQSYLEMSPHLFNNEEFIKLYIASVTHDCEKETDEWQEKISFGEKPPYHTNPEYAKKFVADLLNFLNENGIDVEFDPGDINDIISSQALHMKASAKRPSNVFKEMTRGHKSERWSEISHIVDLFDDIVSKESAESVIDLLNKDEYMMLNERLEFTYHKIGIVRGILTSLLHKACEKAYEKHGFTPFLYYPDSTLYARLKKKEFNGEITIDKIKDSLKDVLNEFIRGIDNESKVVIENPQTKLFSGREFFDKELVDKYFITLRRKYRAKINKTELMKIIEKYFGSLEKSKEKLRLQEVKDSDLIDVIIMDIEKYSTGFPDFISKFKESFDINRSKPQQYIFQLFKEIVYDDEILANDKNFQKGLQKDYDSFFGEGKYNELKSKSTTNPKIDFKRYVKPYWKNDINGTKVEKLATKKQEEILAEKLSAILKNNIDKCPKLPRDEFVNDVLKLLLSDITYPCISIASIRKDAEMQLTKIGASKKKLFNKNSGERLCPVCYKLMPEVNLIRAAFISDEKGVAKVFNNHAVGGLTFGGSVNICKLCYAELLLRRVILGRTPSDLVILFPSLNFAEIPASNVMESVRDVEDKLQRFYSYHNPDLNMRAQLNTLRNITTEILEKKIEEISAELNPNKFIESFTIKISDKTRKNDIKKLEDEIKELYSVEDFNKEFSTGYSSFKEIAEGIFENTVKMPETERNQIIEEARVNPIRYSFVYKTPNFIVISLPATFSYDENEAEVNILLKRLLFASYLYLLTDCAVMVIPGKEVLHIPQTRRMVYAQPNATLKQVLKEDWISLFDLKKWMVATSAAVKLAYDGDYSRRSGIFDVLTQPTVGHILSRITIQKTQSGAPKRADRRLIDMLDKLQDTGVLKNEVVNANYFVHKSAIELGR